MTSHTTIIKYAIWFLGLLIMQVLVFNHIHFLGYATPMPFIYMLLIMHNDTPRWVYVIMGFTLGILIDIAANTIGECASVATLLGLITPHLLNAFSPPDRSDDGFFPSAITMKWGGFITYVTAASFVLCTLFFIIENFSFFHLGDLILDILGSSAITILIILAIEQVRVSAMRRK